MFKQLSLLLFVLFMLGCAETSNQSASNSRQDLVNKVDSHQDPDSGQWLSDMEKAQVLAQAQNKKILIFLTGSDWCHYCQLFVKEVLSQQAFLDYAKEKLVLVELDFPTENVEMSKEQKAHNEKWEARLSEHHNFQGYPTVFLTDSSVNVYAFTSHQGETPQEYIEKLEKMPALKAFIDELSAKAAKASGLEKANLLDELLGYEGEGVTINDISEKEQEIIRLAEGKDEDLYKIYVDRRIDKAIQSDVDSLYSQGLPVTVELLLEVYEKHKAIKAGGGLDFLLSNFGSCFIDNQRPKEGIAFMDKIISDKSYTQYIRQGALLYKGMITLYGNESDESRIERAIAIFEKTLEIEPVNAHGEKAQEILESISQEAGT